MADTPTDAHRAALPPKKRVAAAIDPPSAQQASKQPASPDPAEPSIDPLGLLLRDSEKAAKQARLEPSKIAGFAHPRKPRVGPQYQALVPAWSGEQTAAAVAPPAADKPGGGGKTPS